MKITDGNKTINITMREWDRTGWGSDFANEFFADGHSVFDREREAYVVKDVAYCIEQAMDWKNGTGDYMEEKSFDTEDRLVEVEEEEK